jgi:hypothetical protein
MKSALTTIALLFATGCSVEWLDEPGSAPGILLCGWTPKTTHTFDELEAGRCYLLEARPDAAATRVGVDPCDVAPSRTEWRGGETVQLWARTSSDGQLPFEPVIVDCSTE